MNRKQVFLITLGLLCLFSVSAISKGFVPQTDEAAIRKAAFDKVWNTINEKHFDPAFGGVDWQEVRTIYEPKAMSAVSRAEFHNVLNQMLAELKLSHFRVYTPVEAQPPRSEKRGTIGIKVKMIDGKPVIASLRANSPAAAAGLKTGYIIEKISSKSVVELLDSLEKSFARRTVSENEKNIYRQAVLESFSDGDAETSVKIEVSDEKNRPRSFDVKRAERHFETSQPLGNFPAVETEFEAKRLEKNIGYIRFNIWTISQMPKLREALQAMHDTRGMIFDLRGNPGGVGGMATGLAGLLSKEEISLGTMQGRTSAMKFFVYPQKNVYEGKILIVTDGGSASTSEVFAAGLQETGRAKIVGERTAGMVLPSVFDKLSTGAIFQYAISDYKSPKNVLIEGLGVMPDEEIRQTRQDLLKGRDLALERAVKIIQKKQ